MGLFDVFKRKPSRDAFADAVLKRARVLRPESTARYDPAAFQIHFDSPTGKPWTMILHNAYRDALAFPKTKHGAVIDDYLLSMMENNGDDGLDTVAARLMPVIRDTAMFEWLNLKARAEGTASTDDSTAVLRPFTSDLSIALVLDSERSTQTIGMRSLEKTGLTSDTALQQAIDNLRDRTDPSGMHRDGGVWISAWHDIYDASRLLLTDMVHRLDVHGEPVAAIPSRNHLLVTGSLDHVGIERIATMAADVLEADTRPLGDQLLILRDGRWHPFDAELTPETHRRLLLARYQKLVAAYDEQKKLLDAIHEKEQIAHFVATYDALAEPDSGRIYSTAQWTRDVDTLLPRCDQLLLFCDTRQEVLHIAWDDAAASIPALTDACPGLAPSRFLLTDFPDDPTYEALRQRAIHVTPVRAD